MQKTIQYLKDLRADISCTIEDEYSTSITVGESDLKRIDNALKEIEELQKELEMVTKEKSYFIGELGRSDTKLINIKRIINEI